MRRGGAVIYYKGTCRGCRWTDVANYLRHSRKRAVNLYRDVTVWIDIIGMQIKKKAIGDPGETKIEQLRMTVENVIVRLTSFILFNFLPSTLSV